MKEQHYIPMGIAVIERFHFTKDTTIGELYLNGHFASYVLEDAVRADGVKIDGHTALPEGIYLLRNTWSPAFQRHLPLIYDAPHGKILHKHIPFIGARFHGGNDHTDTRGCPLVASNWDGADKIWGSYEEELVRWCEHFPNAHLIITNTKSYTPLLTARF